MASGTDELERAVAAACEAVGVELVDIELSAGVLRVTVEREQGLDLECVADAARAISALLDEQEHLAPTARYELEVTSPGVERRLRKPEQFQRAIGSIVSVRTLAGVAGDRRAEGVLEAVDSAGFTLRPESGAPRHLDFVEVDRAHTVFDWKAALRADPLATRGSTRRSEGNTTMRNEEARA